MDAATYDLARDLAGYGGRTSACLSVFLDLDPSVVPTDAQLGTHVTSLVDEARRAVAATSDDVGHDDARQAGQDVERVAAYLEGELDRGNARALALYASGRDGVWRDVALALPVSDAVHVGAGFVLGPLVPSLERSRTLVLAAVGRDRGAIWRSEHGRVEPLADLTRDGQGQHDQGGWSQARYARSRDREALTHMRTVADELAQEVPAGSPTLVAIACIPDQRAAFEELLAPHVREAVIGWAAVEAHEGASAVREEAEGMLERRLAEEHHALLERWREQLGRGERATATWEDTLAAADDGSVDTVLLTPGTRPAWACPSCGRASLRAGACELDGAQLRAVPGGSREAALHGTLAGSGGVAEVDGVALAEPDGVGALLRYAAA